MCFSPEASFVTSGVTIAIGAACLFRATHWRELPLAATPVLFGVQQAIEGGLWLVLPSAPHGASAASLTLVYLLFAQVFWPLYAPLAAWVIEPSKRRRRLMLLCLAAGCAVASYMLWRLLAAPREAEIVHRCIVYHTASGYADLTGMAYLTATSLSLLLSSRRAICALGIVILMGSLVAHFFYHEAFLSVWCFFAAAASILILVHFRQARRLRPNGAAMLSLNG